jgi:diaminopimelate decarboxylase
MEGDTRKCNGCTEDYKYSSHLYLEDGHMHCEGVRVKHVQDELDASLLYPSPFFLYSRAQIHDNVRAYKNTLEEDSMPHLLAYSIKANYNAELLRLFKEEGCGMTAVSGNEILLALRVGMEPRWISGLDVCPGCSNAMMMCCISVMTMKLI